jgi:hypothetical protein
MPPTASISRTHSQCQRWGRTPSPRPKPRRSGLHAWKCPRRAKRRWSWWSQSGSNRRPQACKASALPTELWPPPTVVGRGGVEPPTSRLSGVRSNHLSYRPPLACPCGPQGPRAAEGQLRRAGAARRRAPSVSRMKGHEDGGNVLWTGGSIPAHPSLSLGAGAFRHDP